jgi:hypothetical protein
MALAAQAFPWDSISGIGPARVIIDAYNATLWTKPTDIFAQVSPYAVAGTARDIGQTTGPSVYGRNVEESENRIEQTTTVIHRDVTSTQRTLQIPIARLSPENLQLVENAPSIATLAAASGAGSGKIVKFGSIDSLTQYRIALVARQLPEAGLVTEPGGAKRPGWYVAWLHDVALTAENITGSVGRGDLLNFTLTVRSFPVAGQPSGQEEGGHFIEDVPQTIA